MQWGMLHKLLHLIDTEIADPYSPNKLLFIQLTHGCGGFLNCHIRVRPMNLIHIDVVCIEPGKGILNFFENTIAGSISIGVSLVPFNSYFGGQLETTALQPFECLPDYPLRFSKSIHRSGIDQSNSLNQSATNSLY